VTVKEIAEKMCLVLIEEAKRCDVDLTGVDAGNFNSELDRRFGDGGEARCEHFADIAWEYSQQFGKVESKGFEEAQWRAITAALKLLPSKIKGTNA